MSESVVVPGGRDVRGTLDGSGDDADSCVVACPPHPEHGGSRRDARIRAVSDELTDRGLACLRFDYGPWDEGRGELADIRNALAWARERYGSVGLFGYSFGATLALLAATEVAASNVSALAPGASTGMYLDAVAALDDLDCPVQVLVGTRDETVDWEPVAERALERGHEVVEYRADHFFVGKFDRIGTEVADFFGRHLGG